MRWLVLALVAVACANVPDASLFGLAADATTTPSDVALDAAGGNSDGADLGIAEVAVGDDADSAAQFDGDAAEPDGDAAGLDEDSSSEDADSAAEADVDTAGATDGDVASCLCGDDLCSVACGENYAACPADCLKATCGDGTCEAGENPNNCPEDCCGFCGDGKCVGYICAEADPKSPSFCPADCATACGNGSCDLGENATNCSADCSPASSCGNTLCDKNEDFASCALDCGFCGDGVCAQGLGETEPGCPADCKATCAADGDCNDNNACTVDTCSGGGTCKHTGTCDDNNLCTYNKCVLGVCSFLGIAATCADDVACTVDLCDPKAGCVHLGNDVTCTDSNPCTDDVCDGKQGCVMVPNSVTCTDSDVCTENDFCQGGACVAGAMKNCDDKNPCTIDSCEMSKGCTHTADDGAPCEDENLCTIGDVCGDGMCSEGKEKNCTAPGACYTAACDPVSGKCVTDYVTANLPCDDGNACSVKDGCDQGKCKGTAVVCDDNNLCTDDSCDAVTGCVYAANTAPCEDGDKCTLLDVCVEKLCKSGAIKSCEDGQVCTADSCDAVSGNCVYASLPKDGTPCDADTSVCTQNDACSDGKCLAGTGVDCDDKNPCTNDSCDAMAGCAHGANSQPCDDGNACTQNDLCAASQCAGKPLNIQVDCNDGQVCTTDSCDPVSGCTHAANQLGCDDGNPCTEGDLCATKACSSGSNICGCQKDADCASQEDGDLCNGTLYCDTSKIPYGCKVKVATIMACDISKDTTCTTTVCDGKMGKCGAVFAVDGKNCDADGSVCTNGDACGGGLCKAGALVECDDKNPCTSDSCDNKLGCLHIANSLACDADGSVCTVNDICTDKVCVAGAKKVCDDGNVCTDDACDKVTGCVTAANVAVCNDGNACTNGDVCGAGKCGGLVLSCDDKNICTTDTCDVTKGCASTDNTIACDDSNACTSGDVCGVGKCAGTAISCNDTTPCTTDSCDIKLGCLHAANSLACDADGSVCTVNDACANKVCVAGAKNLCDDGNVCTDDACNKVNGCSHVANDVVACDDNDVCTSSDACSAGVCKGVVTACGNKVCDCGETTVSCPGDCLTTGMVLIPAGTFWMGCNATKEPACAGGNETPQHKVTLTSYYMDKTETTVAQYKACVDAGGCTLPSTQSPSQFATYPLVLNHPVNYVDWAQSQAYCKWRGEAFDLPTEAQWEMAARGSCENNGSTAAAAGCAAAMRTYPWGEAAPTCIFAVIDVSQTSAYGCGTNATWAVGSKTAGNGPYGMQDIAGNVYEWTRDFYNTSSYGNLPPVDPYASVNDLGYNIRTVRGNSFDNPPEYSRSGRRLDVFAPSSSFDLGLRCVRSYP